MKINKLNILLIIALVLVSFAFFTVTNEKDKHENDRHGHEEGGHDEGSHGGRVFAKDDLKLEVTIYEKEIPPEFRVYAYKNDTPVPPADIKLDIELHRLGGRVDMIGFKPEGDYLLGLQTVEEPHSFDVTITAEHNGIAYNWEFSQHEGRVELHDDVASRSGIIVDEAGPRELELKADFPAEIKFNADNVAHIIPQTMGVATEVTKTLGDNVSKGEVIAVINSREVAGLKGEYITLKKKLQLAQILFDREKNLRDKKISSEEDYLRARQEYELTRVELESVARKLLTLGIATDVLTDIAGDDVKEMARYEIKSPLDGITVEKHLSVGESVHPDDVLFIVADLSSVWVESSIYPGDISSIAVGQDASITSEIRGVNLSGKISYVSPLAGERTRTAKARITLDNTLNKLLPGSFVTMSIARTRKKAAVAVKKEALQSIRGIPNVFVRYGDIYEARPLLLGESDGGYIEVVNGLEPGEKYVTANSFILKAELGKSEAKHDH